MNPRVLVATSRCWVPTARLAIGLSKAGFLVDVVCPGNHPVLRTRAPQRVHRYSGIAPLAALSGAIAASDPDVIIPGDDLVARQFHELYYREERAGRKASKLSALIARSLGDPAMFRTIDSRIAFLDVARAEGVLIPDSFAFSASASSETWIREQIPAVLKADGTSGGDGVKVVTTPDDFRRAVKKLQAPPQLARACKRALVDHDWTLLWPSVLRQRFPVCGQRFIAGRETTSAVACWNGEVIAALHFELLKKADAAGHGTVMRSIENADMSTATKRMAKRLRLSGLHGFDFMVENGSERAYLIEINPRATQVGHLTLGAGRDIPAALYAAVTGGPVRAAAPVTDGDTFALFPQEWIRDANSPFLRYSYHDVPWDEPELVRVCVESRRKQSGWYAEPQDAKQPAKLSRSASK